MKELARRAGTVLLIGLMAVVPARVLAECADYVTSGDHDVPITGRLIGQRTVTQTSRQSLTGSFNTRLSGGSYQYERTTTTTYDVGIYEMSDGTVKELRCDTYKVA